MMTYKTKDDFNLKVIAESGQCFRFNENTDGSFSIIASGKVLNIKEITSGKNKEHVFELDCSMKDFDKIWSSYFDIETDYSSIRKLAVNDAFLKECSAFSEGMRILNQDKWEMTISFIISQRKSIPAIKTSIERLCKLCGDKISDNAYAFPTPNQILSADVNKLASCGLGYRLSYILSSAETFYSDPDYVKRLETLSDEELIEELKKMQGVGDKVASCIALFGFHRLNFFPKDVWIYRALDEHYPSGFDFDLYKPYNGVIQQYIFFAYRDSHK